MRRLNRYGFRTRKGHMFTAHTIKDILNCRFYLGLIQYRNQEFQGSHRAIISEDAYERAQAQRRRRTAQRTVVGPKGLLQGMISCGNCGRPIQSDRHRFGGAMYRERHAVECATNERSIMSGVIDGQIETILHAVELPDGWQERMAKVAATGPRGANKAELNRQRLRVSRAYADGAFSDSEYEDKLAEIDNRIRETADVALPSLEEAAALFKRIPELWREATPEERRKLVSPLIERVYVDMETKQIGAITPVPAFRRLLEKAIARTEHSEVLLLSQEDMEKEDVWSWWRRGSLKLAGNHLEMADRWGGIPVHVV